MMKDKSLHLKKKIKTNHILAGAGLYLSSGGGVYIMEHFLFMSVYSLENNQ